MLGVIFCVLGVGLILYVGEYLAKAKLLKGENYRKFTHIATGTFIASWPWIISWYAIEVLGVLMLLAVTLNHYKTYFKFNKKITRPTYGDYFFAMAVSICAFMTNNKFFFAMAILHLALADGFAAVVGKNFGKKYEYKVFGQTKSLIGTMTFWITSLYILGAGLLSAYNFIPYNSYYWIILLLPPALALIENLAVYGSDNLVIPVAVVLVLKFAQG